MSPSANRWKAIRLLSQIGFLLCLLAIMLPLTAQTADPLKKTIQIDADQQPLDKVLANIAAGTQVKFAYDVNEVKKYTVTLREKKELTIEEALKKVLQQTSLSFECHANTIVIYNKEKSKGAAPGGVNTAGFTVITYQSGQLVFTGTVVDDYGPLPGVNITI